MERVLVTGGAGYIGSVLVPRLLQEGYAVTVLDRFNARYPSLLSLASNPNFRAIRGDCRDVLEVREALKDCEWVIPLAAIVGAPACDRNTIDVVSTNLGAIVCILSQRSNEQRVLFPNTNSGYGTTYPGVICDETTPLEPISLYGRTKKEAEEAVLEKQNTLSFRFATAFGVSQRMRLDLLVNDFTYRACRDRCLVLFEPLFRRNFIHIQDISAAFLHVMRNFGGTVREQVYNCGLPETLNKVQLCLKIKQELPQFRWYDDKVGEDPDKRDYEVSNARLYGTGFIPQRSVSDGIRELVQAYQMLPGPEFTNL